MNYIYMMVGRLIDGEVFKEGIIYPIDKRGLTSVIADEWVVDGFGEDWAIINSEEVVIP